ncbi:DUF3613 domain-containing protein [Variovorax sp. KBS0712]|uniref:DUF3613 domain-containing protein n=1 Tax=Variovorax sp. KBS0712 TaxID=2578111 RepID=UPI0021B0DB78|nr:DUF3613 domain-containing protein [Variovorax sp. KBS0712]
MKKECGTVFRTLSGLSWAIALLTSSSMAMAQSATQSEPPPASKAQSTQVTTEASANPSQNDATDAEEFDHVSLQVGDATQGLLAWQRSGDIASKTPRPIAGNVAQRSYERYLKSFEFSIPERMSSTVKTSSGTGGAK